MWRRKLGHGPGYHQCCGIELWSAPVLICRHLHPQRRACGRCPGSSGRSHREEPGGLGNTYSGGKLILRLHSSLQAAAPIHMLCSPCYYSRLIVHSSTLGSSTPLICERMLVLAPDSVLPYWLHPLQAMSSSPFAAPFMDRLGPWEKKLVRFQVSGQATWECSLAMRLARKAVVSTCC